MKLTQKIDENVEKISDNFLKNIDLGVDIIQGTPSNDKKVDKEDYIEEIKIKKQNFLNKTADVLNVIVPYGHDSLGYLLLEAASWGPKIKDRKEIIKELLSFGADINYQCPKEYGSNRELLYGENTALHYAFTSNDLDIMNFC